MQDEELLDAEDFFDFQVSKEGGTVPLLPDKIVSLFFPELWIRITWMRIRILLLIKEMEICDHRSLDPPGLHCERLRIFDFVVYPYPHPCWFFRILFLISITPFGCGIHFFISIRALFLIAFWWKDWYLKYFLFHQKRKNHVTADTDPYFSFSICIFFSFFLFQFLYFLLKIRAGNLVQ